MWGGTSFTCHINRDVKSPGCYVSAQGSFVFNWCAFRECDSHIQSKWREYNRKATQGSEVSTSTIDVNKGKLLKGSPTKIQANEYAWSGPCTKGPEIQPRETISNVDLQRDVAISAWNSDAHGKPRTQDLTADSWLWTKTGIRTESRKLAKCRF